MRVITCKFAVFLLVLSAGVIVSMAASPATAQDAENCLGCHRYRGLGRLDENGKEIQLYYVDPNYYEHALGPHARVRCTGCHERSEVEVIPHRKTSAVNCTRICHLSTPSEMETVFTHERINAALNGSVHNDKTLAEANRLLGRPLRPDQSQCLLCHDAPTFRWRDQTWAQQEAHIGRCQVCHTDELPKDTRYYYWHVHARSRPARNHGDVTRVCALCHSNAKIREHFESPDTTASYLASFHGKAMLLGSEETAGCLECHVAELENVHVMLSRNTPASPTNERHLSDTCRSIACHPTAGTGISTAAIHLNLSTSQGIEYLIACVFVLLILFTFGPSVVLQALELLQIIVGRHDPDHHKHHELAHRLMADPASRRALQRFTPHQRVQHWLLFATFTALVLTGFPIKFADRAWAAWLIGQIGNLHRARLIHRGAGALLLAGFAYHIVYVALFAWQQKRRTGKSLMQTCLDRPMVMRWNDWKQMGGLLAYLLFLRRTRPQAGRFSLEEKFEYFGVFWGCILLGVTGLLMWANAWTTQYLSGRILTLVSLVHTFEAFLALLHVGIIHMVGVILTPAVFPLSPAMFTGNTPPEELAEAHSAMLTELAEPIKLRSAGEVNHG